MGGCKRLVDKASKALSIFQQRRDTVKQYIAGEHRTIHTLREGLERGRCIQALCFDEFCMKTLSEIISQAHIYILCWRSDQKNLFTKCHRKMNWPGHTHTYIYICTAIVCIQFLHTHIYTYTVTVIQFFVSVSNHQKIKSIQVCEACVPLVPSTEVFSFLKVWEGSYINIHQMSSNFVFKLRTSMNAGTCWTTQTICCLTAAK